MQTGTLQELDVQPGDVVEYIDTGAIKIIAHVKNGLYYSDGQNPNLTYPRLSARSCWRIISRAPRDETPKPWRDMTPEEKGALLLAAHEGKVIEHDDLTYTDGWEVARSPTWNENIAYRVKPDDVRETVVFDSKYYSFKLMEGYRITFDTINGEPDPTSIRMDRI